jgi:hypothetical protein
MELSPTATWTISMRTTVGGLVIMTGATLLSAAAFCQAPPRTQSCVTCSGPDASYRCEVESPDGKTISPERAQLFCIARLAKDGAHEACSVRRRDTTECTGLVRRYPFDGTLLGLEARPAEPPVDTALAPKDKPKPKEPATVVEASKEAVEASKRSLATINKTVNKTVNDGAEKTKSAAKSTWRCLKSFFSDC